MSGQDQPDRTGRIDPDATRRVDPEATRRVDPGATRRVDPGRDRAPDAGHTQRIEPPGAGGLAGGGAQPWEGTADPYDHRRTDEPGVDEVPPEAGPPDRRGRDAAFGIGGLVVGFLIAVVVIALGTSDRGGDGDVAASSERIEALEADLAERDARIGSLEAQVAEAEAAAGASADDVEAQRRALDERAAGLDDRVAALDERTAALDRREAELDEREQRLVEREEQAEQPAGDEPADGDEGGDGGGLLPDLDTEEVETFIDRVLDRIRELF